MTRLLFITAGLYFDPTDTLTRLRYQILSEAGFSGLIMCVVYDHKHRKINIGDFNLVSLYLPRFLQGYGPIRGILRAVYYFLFCIWFGILKRDQFDVSIGADTFKSGLLCYILSRLSRKPYIVEVAGNYIRAYDVTAQDISWIDRLKQSLVKLLSPFILKNANAIKLLYDSQLDGLAIIDNNSKIFVFHDTSGFDKLDSPAEDRKFILSAGHPWHLKGMDIAILAFNKIQDLIPEYKLCIAGYCTDIREYKKLAKSNPRIVFHEQGLTSEQMKEKFRTCSLYILASRSEAMGRVLLEAMAASKPIIASRVDGVPRVIQDNRNGLLFEPENIDELASKILLLLRDKQLSDRLTRQASEDLNTRFSNEQFTRMYADMVTHAINH